MDDGTCSDDELLELLTCHRSVPLAACCDMFVHLFTSAVLCIYIVLLCAYKDVEGPFPWKSTSQAAREKRSTTAMSMTHGVDNAEPSDVAGSFSNFLANYMGETGSLTKLGPMKVRCPAAPIKRKRNPEEVGAEGARFACIAFRLAPYGALAGTVLQHARAELETLIEREAPLIFKIGITHNALWRFCNSMYGYCRDLDNWSHMIILHVSEEPHGPAMLEASLIDRFRSNLIALLVETCTEELHAIHVSV